MIRKILLLFALIGYINLFSQNLIPNPGFEDVNICHKYYMPCSPKAWRSTVLKNISYKEYLGEKKQRGSGVKPAEGNRHIALRMYNYGRDNDRSFTQVPILCPLVAGATYELSFQFYTSFFMVEELEVAFVDTMYFYKNNLQVQKLKPQISIPFEKNVKSRKWTKVSTTFVADGTELGLIIGNFKTDSTTQIRKIVKKKKKNLTNRVYYAFDDFSLTAIDSSGITDCDIEKNRLFIYNDSLRHIRKARLKTISDIPKSTPIVEEVEAVAPPNEPTIPEEPLYIGEQEVNTEEDFVFENITFETNKAVLRPSSFRPLEAIATFLLNHPEYQLLITGHTDNIGTENFNKTLSLQRAKAVAAFLIREGVDLNRLITAGKGELEPVETNETEAGRAQNRRVAFKLQLK